MISKDSLIKISAVAICYNEAKHVKAYIKQLHFADEIIFIDSYSSDDTVTRAQQLGVKVIQHKFKNFSDQRNFALTQAKHDWVLFFDLDERIPPALEREIKQLLEEGPKAKAYAVKRRFFYFDQPLRYGGWRNDTAIRMFNKHHGTYNGDLVHEKLEVAGSVGKLHAQLDHYSFQDFDAYNEKLTLYSKLQALQLYREGKKPNAYHFIVRPWYRFFKQFFLQAGFLDGKAGFIVSYIHAFAVFKRYLQLWMLYRKIE